LICDVSNFPLLWQLKVVNQVPKPRQGAAGNLFRIFIH
jgi:hypothetical protein